MTNNEIFIAVVIAHVMIAIVLGRMYLPTLKFLNQRDKQLVNDANRYIKLKQKIN